MQARKTAARSPLCCGDRFFNTFYHAVTPLLAPYHRYCAKVQGQEETCIDREYNDTDATIAGPFLGPVSLQQAQQHSKSSTTQTSTNTLE